MVILALNTCVWFWFSHLKENRGKAEKVENDWHNQKCRMDSMWGTAQYPVAFVNDETFTVCERELRWLTSHDQHGNG